MKYTQALKELGKDFDPFLHIKKQEIVDETPHFFVIPARAPYTKNHLLIIPKRKVYVLRELEMTEKIEMMGLLDKWSKKLHVNHSGVNILLRDGLVGDGNSEIGKSINHLHVHLIPDMPIGPDKLNWENRMFFSDKEYIDTVRQLKKHFLGIDG